MSSPIAVVLLPDNTLQATVYTPFTGTIEGHVQLIVNEYAGGGGGATNLGYTAAPTNGIVTSDTGTDATITAADGTNAGLMLPAEKTKLGYIAITQAVNLDTIETDSHTHSNKAILDATTASFLTADETKLDGIEALADVTDAVNIASSIDGATAKTTPVDADTLPLIDSAAANVLKKVSWANIKATLKTYFDSFYAAIVHTHVTADITDITASAAELNILDGATLSTTELNYVDGVTSAIQTQLGGKQETLVSATNIKTINSTSLLGSGDIAISGGGIDLATVGDNFVLEEDFYSQSIPDGWTLYSSGSGSGASYSNTVVEGHKGFVYPSPGTSSGATSGRCHICPTVDTGPTVGWTIDSGEIDFTVIIQTASIAQSGTEDFFDIFGFSNSFFSPNPDNSVAITRQQGVNSGNWVFRYRTSSNQVTINGGSGSATSTWFALRFKISASTHACEFWIDGVSQGTGTPASKITATSHAALYVGIAKVASAGGEPRPRWDYIRVQQNLGRN